MVLAGRSICFSSRNGFPSRLSPYALCSFIIAFAIMGVSVSVSGPSVIFLEEIVHTWEDEIALIFTSRSVGALGGWLLSVAILEDTPDHCGSLIGFGLFGLTFVNFGVAFSYHLWWLLAAFAFQGSFIVVAAQGELLRPLRSPNEHLDSTVAKNLLLNQMSGVFIEDVTVATSQPYKASLEQGMINSLLVTSTTNITPQSGSFPAYNSSGSSPAPSPSTSSAPLTASSQGSFFNTSTSFVVPDVEEIRVTTSSGGFFKTKPSGLSSVSEAPMKPSVVDAEHLNQDSSSADGSNTAAKMKLADGDVRLTNSEDSGVLEVQKDGEMKKPSVVDATHLSQDQKTADGSSTADKMKHGEKLHDNEPKLPLIIVPSLVPQEPKPESIRNDTIRSSKSPVLTTANPLPNNDSVSFPMSLESSSQNHESKLRSNDSYRLTSSYNTKWDRRIPRRYRDEHMRYQYMKSVKCVYVSVGLLTIIAWFILLPLTGLIPYVRHFFECFATEASLRQSSQVEEQSRRGFNAKSNDDVERTDFAEDPQPEIRSLTENESPPPQIESKTVAWSVKGENGQLQEKPMLHVSVSVPNLAVLRSVRHNPSQAHRKNVESNVDANGTFQTPEQSVYLTYAPEPTIWPLVTWPTDFWVLAATFLFAGLETTYGAFIHSFTLRTLNWTPVDALLVTALFWSGDAIGRLCHLCLGANSDIGISLLQNAVNFPSEKNIQSSSSLLAQRSRRRERSFHIAALFIRTAGSLICFICASMMKEMTTSHLVYYPGSDQSGDEVFEPWCTSKGRATWLSTLGLGLGLGATASSGLNVYTPHGQRFYLVFLLGQLAVPATSGYLTERVLHKNASETLGRTALILSILMFFSLLIDLLLRAFRRFFWWKIVVTWFSCFSREENGRAKTKQDAIDADPHIQASESSVDVAWETPSSGLTMSVEMRQREGLGP
ncbi:unnamed protein product [Hydatigera taeniaeformis]|uniref:MFS_1_like domain-containing protein n=1 Tax=Hydatigena taeniaeformis TaxID=6205 RepID=A0A0R3X104_HYDTA|nr:unnamed protein product [Hydatigera taeniaeformis]